MMSVEQHKVGEFNSKPVEIFTITNQHQTQIKLLTYGATWQNWEIPQEGDNLSLIAHYDDWTRYQEDYYQTNKTVAPVAGRITNAHFILNRQEYQVVANENENLLHSGSIGLQHQNFTGHIVDDETVEFYYQLKNNIFPGNLDFHVRYQLTDNDRVNIQYIATSDQDTLFNPTCHVYFNIGDQTDVNSQCLQIKADKLVELDEQKLPTGELLPLAGAFDFRERKTIDQGLKQLQQENGKQEFDNAFYTPDDLVATLSDGQRFIDLYSDRNALVMFTASPQIPATQADWHHYKAIALELQTLPDAINHPGFGDIRLSAQQTISYTNSYQYRNL